PADRAAGDAGRLGPPDGRLPRARRPRQDALARPAGDRRSGGAAAVARALGDVAMAGCPAAGLGAHVGVRPRVRRRDGTPRVTGTVDDRAITVRTATAADAADIARVQVRGWHEAYTGRMPQS